MFNKKREVEIILINKTASPLARLFLDSKRQWPGLICIALSSLLSGVLQAAAMRAWGKIVDLGTAGMVSAMITQAIVMVIILVVDCVRTAFHYMIDARTTESMFLAFRQRAFSVIAHGKVQVLEKKMRSGDMAARLNSDIESLCEMVAGQFTWFVQVSLQAAVAVVYCSFLSWQLSLAYFLLLPVSIWIIRKISMPVQHQQKAASDSTGRAMNVAADVLSNMAVVKSFRLENEMCARFGSAVDASTCESIKSEKVVVKMTGVKYLVSVVQMVVLFILGTFLVSRGVVSVGSVLAFVALSASVRAALDLSDNMGRSIRQAAALSQRLYEVLDLPVEENKEELEPVPGTDYVDMEHLQFLYEDNSDLFKDLTLRLKKGQKVGLAGPSGCGKSTIIKLICKFYEHADGKLSLFGHMAEAWSPMSLRRQLALVTQEPALFEGTIFENVLYGRLDATEDEVVQALKDAYLWDFVCSLQDGMHTRIGEYGSRLSGGQKQRLSVARAILKNAPLILLDEATSALDTHSEAELQTALDRLMEGKSALIVSHRLTTLSNADYIYCMDGGKVVEHGTREELLAAKGYFYHTKLQQEMQTETQGDNYEEK